MKLTWHSHHESKLDSTVLLRGARLPALLIKTCGTPTWATISLNALFTDVSTVMSRAKRRTLIAGLILRTDFSVSARPLPERPMSTIAAAPARANEAAKLYSIPGL